MFHVLWRSLDWKALGTLSYFKITGLEIVEVPAFADYFEFNIKWSILKRAKAYMAGLETCNLYLAEKLCILNR